MTNSDSHEITIVQGEFPSISATFILDQITGLIDRGYEIKNWCTYNPQQQSVHEDIRKYGLLEKTKYLQFPNNIGTDNSDKWVNEFARINGIERPDGKKASICLVQNGKFIDQAACCGIRQ